MTEQIIKELGYGMIGTVYKVKYNNKYYAMKIEHILDTDKVKDIKSPIWRENDFVENIASKYKDQFVQMYEYKFVDDCTHIQKYSLDVNKINEYSKNKITKLAASNTCIKRYYELLDGSIQNLIPTLNQQQIYSFIIQLAYIIHILETNGYVHGDFHVGNIGYLKTKKKYIYCDKIKVPTFGYIFKAIDLGSVLHEKYMLSNSDKLKYNSLFKKELYKPYMTTLIDFENFWQYVDKNKIKIDYKHINNFKEWNMSKSLNDMFTNITYKYKLNLLRILYPEQTQKLLLGNKFNKTLPPKLYIDTIDIIFMYKCNFDSKKIFDYFIKHL